MLVCDNAPGFTFNEVIEVLVCDNAPGSHLVRS